MDCQALLSMGFSRPENSSGLPFPSPEDLSNPGTEPMSPELQADSFICEPSGKDKFIKRRIGVCFVKNIRVHAGESTK